VSFGGSTRRAEDGGRWWLVFTRDPAARFHATGGVGFSLGFLRIGAEGGYLSSGALIGGRVSFAF
jgi:hypothetical protein